MCVGGRRAIGPFQRARLRHRARNGISRTQLNSGDRFRILVAGGTPHDECSCVSRTWCRSTSPKTISGSVEEQAVGHASQKTGALQSNILSDPLGKKERSPNIASQRRYCRHSACRRQRRFSPKETVAKEAVNTSTVRLRTCVTETRRTSSLHKKGNSLVETRLAMFEVSMLRLALRVLGLS